MPKPDRTKQNSTSSVAVAQERGLSRAGAVAGTREVARAVTYQGPLPHPDVLRGFGELVPTAPERIVRVWEDDSAHERLIETTRLRVQAQGNARLHWMAFAVCVLALGVACFFGYRGETVLAGTVVSVLCATTVLAFLRHQKKGDDELESSP